MSDEHSATATPSAPAAPAAPGGQASFTPDQAATELSSIRSAAAADPSHAYNDRRHPQHKAMHARVLELTRQSSGPISGFDDDDSHISSTSLSRTKPAAIPSGAEGAQAEIDAIRAAALGDPKHPYNDKRHPEHKALHLRLVELYRLAAGEGSDDDGHDDRSDDDVDSENGTVQAGSDAEFDEALRKAHIRAVDASVEGLQEEFAGIKAFFADAEISAAEANEVIGIYNEIKHVSDDELHDPARIEKQADACMRALKAVWKDETDAKLQAAGRALNKLDRDGALYAYIDETRLGDDPRIIRLFANVAERRGW